MKRLIMRVLPQPARPTAHRPPSLGHRTSYTTCDSTYHPVLELPLLVSPAELMACSAEATPCSLWHPGNNLGQTLDLVWASGMRK